MQLDTYWLLRLAIAIALVASCEARRVRVQPVEDDDIQYYSPESHDGSGRAVVLVSSDDYNGLYGQPSVSRDAQDNYIPRSRGSTSRGSPTFKDTRVTQKESSKPPPVQTIRNYNKVNDDGSFTFGYEAADGSFKEETRGTDCVVRGKYGYVDPDGNKREFTYVSGNPCDPNATKEDESRERAEEESNEPENVPANYPTRPIRPLRPIASTVPVTPKPAVTVFHNTYAQEEEEVDSEIEQPEPEQVLRAQPLQPARHRLVRPTYISEEQHNILQQRPRIIPSTTPAPVSYQEETRPYTISPRPLTVTPSSFRTQAPVRTQPPATTYRPQLLQVAVTPRPALLYTKQIAAPQRTTYYPSTTQAPITRVSAVSPSRGTSSAALDFASEFHRFQQDNQVISSTPSSVHRPTKPAPVAHTTTQLQSNPVYSSELVYDPSSGQYKTALYQTLPQTEGDFTLNHRIQPYVHQPAPQLVNLRQLQQQSPLYRTATAPRTGQAVYQQQQAELQLQNSQQLFAQQQRSRAQQRQQQAQQQQQTQQAQQHEPQQFYYIQPQALHSGQSGLASGQIEAFLRGHNIQF